MRQSSHDGGATQERTPFFTLDKEMEGVSGSASGSIMKRTQSDDLLSKSKDEETQPAGVRTVWNPVLPSRERREGICMPKKKKRGTESEETRARRGGGSGSFKRFEEDKVQPHNEPFKKPLPRRKPCDSLSGKQKQGNSNEKGSGAA